jgi:hypothetical protein
MSTLPMMMIIHIFSRAFKKILINNKGHRVGGACIDINR